MYKYHIKVLKFEILFEKAHEIINELILFELKIIFQLVLLVILAFNNHKFMY